jgi:hypothetical protein
MSEPHGATQDHHEPGWYEIRIKGHLDNRWADRFENMRFTHASDGTTILAGPLVDQAAVHGLLRKVRDLGLHLVSFIQVGPTPMNGLDGNTDTDHRSTQETTT